MHSVNQRRLPAEPSVWPAAVRAVRPRRGRGGRGGGGSRAGGGGSRTLGHGARVRLVGLVAEASRYNGLIGVVRGDRPEANGTWRVEVTKARGETLPLSSACARAHLSGRYVRL